MSFLYYLVWFGLAWYYQQLVDGMPLKTKIQQQQQQQTNKNEFLFAICYAFVVMMTMLLPHQCAHGMGEDYSARHTYACTFVSYHIRSFMC